MPALPQKRAGVYRIVNTVTGKCYVGSGSRCVQLRMRDHLRHLRRGDHANDYLQKAWNKYGEGLFRFEVVEMCWPFQAVKREQFWMDRFQSYDRSKGYNIAPVAGSNRGIAWSDAAKARMSEGAKKRLERPGERERLAEQGRSAVATPEARRKCGNGMRGRFHTAEVRARIAAASKGRPKSAKTLEKMREANLGKKLSPEHVEKVRKARIGTKASAETRAKMRAAWARRKAEGTDHLAKLKAGAVAYWKTDEARKQRSEAMRRIWEERRRAKVSS